MTTISFRVHRFTSEQEAALEVLNEFWNRRFPVDPVGIATKMGLDVYGRGGVEDSAYTASGGLHRYEGRQAVCFNSMEPVIRQRFIVAHVLGHLVYGDEQPPAETGDVYASTDPAEARATRFARELLMPRAFVRDRLQTEPRATVQSLAEHFGVSRDAMGHRLLHLGLG